MTETQVVDQAELMSAKKEVMLKRMNHSCSTHSQYV